MGGLTTDSTPGGSTPAAAPTAESVAHDPRHHAIGCPECFDEFQRNRHWWKARLEVREWSGSSSPVTTCRRSSSSGATWARFGVGSSTSSTPPRGSATWEQRFGRLFETLQAGDVLVVVSERALGQRSDEVARTIRTLRRHTSW
jgi:hypothetical protein